MYYIFMQIPSFSNKNLLSFKRSCVNINALSDTHGNLNLANNAVETLRKQKDDVFIPSTKSNKNILAVCGDWFMNGSITGYTIAPERQNFKFQLDILNEVINQVSDISKGIHTLFVPGNHEFDGGVDNFDKAMSHMNCEVLSTNMDLEKSTGLERALAQNNIINEKIFEVEDDKNPNIKNKILFLGISPVNMKFYQKKMDGVKFIDNINKISNDINFDDYKKTYDDCVKRIDEFKKENKDGIVVLLSHTGVGFADRLAKEGKINLCFDGHEHLEQTRVINGIPIIPLSQNFKRIINSKIMFDDNGKLEQIRLNQLSPLQNETLGPISALFYNLFGPDLVKKYSITSKEEGLEVLDTEDIRAGNNYLSNFVTDAVLEEIKLIDSDVDFFALNSSSIRSPLPISSKKSITPIDLVNLLSGIRPEESQLMTTKLSGYDLLYLIKDNFLFNKRNPQRNSLIQYSGLIIDKTNMLKDIKKGLSDDELLKYVIDSRTNKPIEGEKEYKIANVEKYFNKSLNRKIREMKNDSEYLNQNLQDLLRQYFERNKNMVAKCDVRLK